MLLPYDSLREIFQLEVYKRSHSTFYKPWTRYIASGSPTSTTALSAANQLRRQPRRHLFCRSPQGRIYYGAELAGPAVRHLQSSAIGVGSTAPWLPKPSQTSREWTNFRLFQMSGAYRLLVSHGFNVREAALPFALTRRFALYSGGLDLNCAGGTSTTQIVRFSGFVAFMACALSPGPTYRERSATVADASIQRLLNIRRTATRPRRLTYKCGAGAPPPDRFCCSPSPPPLRLLHRDADRRMAREPCAGSCPPAAAPLRPPPAPAPKPLRI